MVLEHFKYEDENYVIKLRLDKRLFYISTHYENGGFATGIERTIDNVMGYTIEEMVKTPLLQILIEESKLDVTKGLWGSFVGR